MSGSLYAFYDFIHVTACKMDSSMSIFLLERLFSSLKVRHSVSRRIEIENKVNPTTEFFILSDGDVVSATLESFLLTM